MLRLFCNASICMMVITSTTVSRLGIMCTLHDRPAEFPLLLMHTMLRGANPPLHMHAQAADNKDYMRPWMFFRLSGTCFRSHGEGSAAVLPYHKFVGLDLADRSSC